MDRGVVEQCLAGDARAWRAFVAHYRPPILRIFSKFVEESAVPDLEQELWARLVANDRRVLRVLAGIEPGEGFALVTTIARNLARDHLRRSGTAGKMLERLEVEAPTLAADADRTSLEAERRELHRLAAQAGSSEEDRELLRRYLDLGLTPREIALESPAIGFEGVRTRLRRLLRRMRLASLGEGPDTG